MLLAEVLLFIWSVWTCIALTCIALRTNRVWTPMEQRREQAEMGATDFSNVWFQFDSISPMFSFKPFPTNI